MNLVCKIACLALLMNTLPGIGQERVFYKTVQVGALNIFYREAGPANGPVILLLHGVPTSSRMYQALLESPLRMREIITLAIYIAPGMQPWQGSCHAGRRARFDGFELSIARLPV